MKVKRTQLVVLAAVVLSALVAGTAWHDGPRLYRWWAAPMTIEDVGIAVPDAELIYEKNYGFDQLRGGGTTVRVYRLPAEYAQSVVQNCSSIHFHSDVIHVADYDKDVQKFMVHDGPGCTLEKDDHANLIGAVLIDGKLVVTHVYQ